MYTLQNFFKDAKLKHPVAFADFIEMDPEKLPRKHQIKNLNHLICNEYWGLYDEPGTGKTMSAHAYGLFWVSEGERVVCVMPPNLVYQFEEELYAIYRGVERFVTSHVLDDGPAKRKKLYAEWDASGNWPQFLCMSYQMFQREYKKLLGKYRVGIFDEAQSLKNSESKIYKQVKEWQGQRGGTSGVWMTGTPIHNELVDAYSLIELTSPGTYFNFKLFDRMHCLYKSVPLKEPRRMKNGRMQRKFRVRTGYRNVETINKHLYQHGSRMLKKDVSEIKDPVITEVPVKLDLAHLSLYKKLVKERMLQVTDEELVIATNAQALRMKLLQIVTCPELFTADMKFTNQIVETGRAIIDSIDLKESKVIMFSNFRDSVRNLATYFEELNPALMYGDSDSEKGRQKFIKDDSCRLLIANPKSAGAGFNFQHQCHNVIFMEPTGVPGDFKQCMNRVVRHGQEKLVNVWILKALGTISPKATQEMRRKEGEAQAVYKDRHTFLSDFKVA